MVLVLICVGYRDQQEKKCPNSAPFNGGKGLFSSFGIVCVQKRVFMSEKQFWCLIIYVNQLMISSFICCCCLQTGNITKQLNTTISRTGNLVSHTQEEMRPHLRWLMHNPGLCWTPTKDVARNLGRRSCIDRIPPSTLKCSFWL